MKSRSVPLTFRDRHFSKGVAKFGLHVVRHMQQGDAEIVLDAQLLREWSSGITRHGQKSVFEPESELTELRELS